MPGPIDLSITGKPSPRIEHPGSAGRRRTPMNENRTRNQKSSIFSSNPDENQINRRPKSGNSAAGGVITKAELQTIKNLTSRNNDEVNEKRIAVMSPGKPAPKGVPKLALDTVVGDDNDLSYNKLPPKSPQIHTPTSKDTHSWGTPLNKSSQVIKGGGWQVNQSRKSERKPVSSQRKHDDVPSLELGLSQSNAALGALRQAARKVNEDLQIEYLGAENQKKIEALRKRGHDQKFEFVDNTMLSDQVGNLKVSEEKPAPAAVPFGVHERFDARNKRHQDLFNSSTPEQSLTEIDLSKRLQFGARILSLDGHNARREISGFFFVSDRTITMYEFRQFGTRSTALPFIQKGNYCYLTGHRKGQAFNILDISIGKDLVFSTNNQASLPETLTKKDIVTFRITEVDEDNKNALLYHGCKTINQRRDVDNFVKKYIYEEKSATNQTILNVRENIRKKLQSRGGKIMTSLHNHFKTLDQSGDGLLDKNELKNALKQYRIDIDDQSFESVWGVVDRNNDGSLDYSEFVRGFFGEMTEQRKKWVRKAFTRLDPAKSGTGKVENLQKFFCASRHPDVIQGKLNESDVMNGMLDIFQSYRRKQEIPFSEFEAYYEGISMSTVSDDDFINLIRSSWTV